MKRLLWMLLTVAFSPASFGQLCGVAAIDGAPFSADQLTYSTWVTGKGGPSDPEVSRFYRDSAGRMRIENTVGEAPTQAQQTTISDPIAGYTYSWNSRSPFVRRIFIGVHPPEPIPPTVSVLGSNPAASLPLDSPARQAEIKYELLGMQVLEGVPVEGDRITFTWPPGSNHNNRELVTGNERWVSGELRTNILTKFFLEFGERTCKLVDVSRAEPDTNLFQPPTGYTIVDDHP